MEMSYILREWLIPFSVHWLWGYELYFSIRVHFSIHCGEKGGNAPRRNPVRIDQMSVF